jgi:hypothetical protein
VIETVILAMLDNTQQFKDQDRQRSRAITISSRTRDYVSYAKAKINNPTQFECLDKLYQKESSWRTLKNPQYAANPNSSAYGIPQALPGKKMAEAGSDWKHNPITQINWGLQYIEKRYKTPCKAWEHSQIKGWY